MINIAFHLYKPVTSLSHYDPELLLPLLLVTGQPHSQFFRSGQQQIEQLHNEALSAIRQGNDTITYCCI